MGIAVSSLSGSFEQYMEYEVNKVSNKIKKRITDHNILSLSYLTTATHTKATMRYLILGPFKTSVDSISL